MKRGQRSPSRTAPIGRARRGPCGGHEGRAGGPAAVSGVSEGSPVRASSLAWCYAPRGRRCRPESVRGCFRSRRCGSDVGSCTSQCQQHHDRQPDAPESGSSRPTAATAPECTSSIREGSIESHRIGSERTGAQLSVAGGRCTRADGADPAAGRQRCRDVSCGIVTCVGCHRRACGAHRLGRVG